MVHTMNQHEYNKYVFSWNLLDLIEFFDLNLLLESSRCPGQRITFVQRGTFVLEKGMGWCGFVLVY